MLQVLLAAIGLHLVHGLVLEGLVVLVCIRIKIIDVVEEEHAAALIALVRFLRRHDLLEGFAEAVLGELCWSLVQHSH